MKYLFVLHYSEKQSSLKKIIAFMRNLLILLFITVFQVFAEDSYSQKTKLTLNLADVSIETVLNEIENQSGFYFLCNKKLVDLKKKVSLNVEDAHIGNVLNSLFRDTDTKYLILERQIVLTPSGYITSPQPSRDPVQQAHDVRGIVTDEFGEPLVGVTILIKGTLQGTITDIDGNFELRDVPDDAVLVVSFVGMNTREIPVEGNTVINVTLEQGAIGLQEVVSIGYMTQRRADLTGSVAVVTKNGLEKNKYSNVLRTIQGKVPGVYVISGGDPASGVGLNIRGITSVNASSPLLVIDGVPSTASLWDLNPNDIESIQILKDAASASIYGARAASGVILVNTLQPKTGDLTISYETKLGVSKIFNKPDLCNAEEWGIANWMSLINDGLDPNTGSDLYNFDWHYDGNGVPVLDKVTPIEWLNSAHTQKSADTDWWNEVYKPAFQQDHQLTILHGTEKSKIMFSLNYLHDNGNVITNYLERYSIRLNSTFNLLNGRLRVGENMSVANRLAISSVDYISTTVTRMHPLVPVYDIYGGWGGSAREYGMDETFNPVYTLENNKDNPSRLLKIIGNIFAELDVINGLTLRTQFGIDNGNGYNRYINRQRSEAGGLTDANNSVEVYSNISSDWIWTNTLNYKLSKTKHELDVVAGIELFHHDNEFVDATRNDILLETRNYAYFNSATGVINVTGVGNEYALISYFGKVNYSYLNKYLLSFTGRIDGSSKFPVENQYGFFPAVSAGWRISEEGFMDFVPAISNLKARISWGVNGNSDIPANGIMTTFGTGYDQTSYSITGAESGQLPSGYYALHLGNPLLKWESTIQTNFGIDFGLFRNRMTGSIDLYHKITEDMLFEPDANPVYGEGAEMWINAADMTNNGFEAILTYNSAPGRDFVYSLTGNFSLNRNKINNIPEGLELEYGGNGLDDNILGRPLRSIYGFIAEGIFKTQDEVDRAPEQPGKDVGRIKYKDLDGDGQITWEHDRTWIGNYDPDFIFGIDFSAGYKNFDFSMFWQGVVGNDVFNDYLYLTDFINLRNIPYQNHAKEILDAWFPGNTDSDKPALTNVNSNEEGRPSTYFIQNGSYLKLRSIELGYTLPPALSQKISVTHLRVYFSAQNLILIKKWWGDDAFTGLDPEIANFEPAWSAYSTASNYIGSYPRPTVFNFGIQSTF